MNKIATVILCCLFFQSFAGKTTFEKLCEVNKCWKEQEDVNPAWLPAYNNLSEKEWIRTHLSIVEQTLRNRNTSQLSASQKQNRLQCLDQLHNYWLAGNFPQNEDYMYRTPIFIDRYDNFCAVGYLVKASGHEDVSRMIASKTNLAYVKEMNYPELASWADANGFKTEELAWIQPTYPPNASCQKLGNGVDGAVNELYPDVTDGRLYVGGSFVNVDDAILANNVAYITEHDGTYTWHNMGSGINGKVNAILRYQDKIFVGGHFTNAGGNAAGSIAYWDGSAWNNAGCIDGTVNNLAIYNGELYAGGSFDVCASMVTTGFAKWNGSSWQPIMGLSGHVNTMQVMGTKLILGGAMVYSSQSVTALKWDDVTGFETFDNNLNNEVMDFEVYPDTLYAACKYTSANDSLNVFAKLAGNTWVPGFKSAIEAEMLYPQSPQKTINTLCSDGSNLNMGGYFYTVVMMGTALDNCYNLGDNLNVVTVDSEVNKMVMYKNDLIIGGKFKTGNGPTWTTATLNGIAKRSGSTTSVPALATASGAFNVYPDPVNAAGVLTIENNIGANHYTFRDMTGRLQASGTISTPAEKINVTTLAQGVYLMEVSNERGEQMTKKVVIE